MAEEQAVQPGKEDEQAANKITTAKESKQRDRTEKDRRKVKHKGRRRKTALS